MASPSSSLDAVAPPLRAALVARGIESLTDIQRAVLDPGLDGVDLRVRSRTGSGKTVAVGLVIAPHCERDEGDGSGPLALVIVPTRELAAQVQGELGWLLAGLKARAVAVTGGTSVLAERRALSAGPEVVVGTPGRLLDHLTRGAIDPSSLRSVVLDEADQMLDLGFRDDLEAILARLPEDRQTHLVSATFTGPALELADRYQREAVLVEAGRAGEANQDIEFVAHPVQGDEREGALVNLLLAAGDERSLVFVRTRAQTSEVASRLNELGFSAAPLSGEMEQRERTRALDAFRAGRLRTLVATDVAARGIDVADVSQVIHLDLPGDAEALTHRSGRTGRAGRKGKAVVLVPPQARGRAVYLFRQAGARVTWAPAPGPDEVRAAAEARLEATLVPDGNAASGEPAAEPPPELIAFAARLLEKSEPAALVARLLGMLGAAGPCEPYSLTPVNDPRPARHERDRDRDDRPRRAGGPARPFVQFAITWGSRHGADPRRLLALVCRRGGIQGHQVGAIDIGPMRSTFEVAAEVAEAFGQKAGKPDERDPRVRIFTAEPARGDDRGPERPRRPGFKPRSQPSSPPPSAPPPPSSPPPPKAESWAELRAEIRGGEAPPRRRPRKG